MSATRRIRSSSHESEGEVRRAPATGGPRSMSASAAPLLFAPLCEHRVLGLLGDPELQHALRGDRDRLAGRRVPSDASLAVNDHELYDAGEGEAAPRFLVRE